MSVSYAISVENECGANTNYAVCMEPPGLDEGGLQSWMTVLYTSFVPNHGNFEIRTGPEWYAWVGTVPTPPAPGVIVNTGMVRLARLGTHDSAGSTFEYRIVENYPILSEIIPPSAGFGAFSVETGLNIPEPNHTYLVGVAKVNNRGQVASSGVTLPGNNMNISVVPKTKFVVFESQQQQVVGEIVDHDSVVRNGATIDFSHGAGHGKFFARVVQGLDGRYSVRYYDKAQ